MSKCSSSFETAANYLTRSLGEGVKGPTINAVASSLPELLISSLFLFYYKDIEGFSAGYGAIIGSSAFNIAVIPVLSFLFIYFSKEKVKVFKIKKSVVKQDTFFLLGSIFILSLGFVLGVNFYLATLLILFYFVYILYILKTRVVKKDSEPFVLEKFIKDNQLEIRNKIIYAEADSFFSSLLNFKLYRIFFNGKVNSFTSTIVVLLSVFIIGASCYLLVLSTEHISHVLGINLFFGAFIIAAIASSIPDTIFSVKDAKKNKFDDSFSNAYGSNIFDICIGIGFPVLVYSFIYGPINMDMPIERIGWLGDNILNGNLFLWSTLILFLYTLLVSSVYYKINLKVKSALIILFLYMIFLVTLFIF